MYVCPVCNYDEMPNPPMGYEICAGCGTEFDENVTGNETIIRRLRMRFLNSGSKWWAGNLEQQPEQWPKVFRVLR